jgi:hypothetical protein
LRISEGRSLTLKLEVLDHDHLRVFGDNAGHCCGVNNASTRRVLGREASDGSRKASSRLLRAFGIVVVAASRRDVVRSVVWKGKRDGSRRSALKAAKL